MSDGRTFISDDTKEAIRQAVDIEDIASEFTTLKRRGKRLLGLCPFHKEKTPSFSVNPEQGFYYCFGCGAGGDAIKLHMELTGDDFVTTLEMLARRYAIPLERRRASKAAVATGALLTAAQEFFVEQLRKQPVPQRYLDGRKIDRALVERFGVGYAPDEWRALSSWMHNRGEKGELLRAGLVAVSDRAPDRPYDRFRNRLMFPIHTPSGQLVGFGGRTLGDDRAKYVNTAETERFQKSTLLYGLHLARRSIQQDRKVLLVEGYFDVIGAYASGIEGVVASMGTSLTQQQVRLLARYSDEVVVGYDGDSAGDEAARRALPLLLAAGLKVSRAQFPSGQDPDSLRVEESPEAVREVVADAKDSLVLEIERVPPGIDRDPHEQAAEANRLRELIGAIKDPVLRHGYARRAGQRLGVPEELVLRVAPESRGPSPPPDETEPARAVTSAPLIRSLEERVVQLLLVTAPEARPTISRDAFRDPSCRLLFDALQAGRELGPQLLSDVASDHPAHATLAGLLVEEVEDLSGRELRELAGELVKAWTKRRLAELARALVVAQQDGDDERVRELLLEREDLKVKSYGLER